MGTLASRRGQGALPLGVVTALVVVRDHRRIARSDSTSLTDNGYNSSEVCGGPLYTP
jgi:hypothetical protein